MKQDQPREIPALRVKQWLPEWEEVKWIDEARQSKPLDHFYLFSLQASELKSLSQVHRRSVKSGQSRSSDLNAQRAHDVKRSQEISRYRRFGFPWSDLSEAQRASDDFSDLRKPGWLPTAIIVNILTEGQARENGMIEPEHLIRIVNGDGLAKLVLPAAYPPEDALAPLEVIDGQHRLWAFDESDDDDFELPVVAFHGLDRSWQAYLFWTINIKPKRINASLAFDLYPLLRNEEWLERFYGHSIYREARAQEIVQILWSHPSSPWRDRINMLGDTGLGKRQVTQASWVRSLFNSFIRPWHGSGPRLGGLFGAPVRSDTVVLGWPLSQQSAFVIFLWESMQNAVASADEEWAASIRINEPIKVTQAVLTEAFDTDTEDAAFSGQYALLNTDQGVRGFLQAANDILFVSSDDLGLSEWQLSVEQSDLNTDVDLALSDLQRQASIANFIYSMCAELASFDWRASSFPGLTRVEQRNQAIYRGSAGYKALRDDLIRTLASTDTEIGAQAQKVARIHGIP